MRCAYRPLTRKPILPRFSVARGAAVDEDQELRRQASEGLQARLAAHGLAPGRTRGRLRKAPRLRARRHRQHDVRRLFPHRRRFHPMGEGARDSGRAGARLGRGLAGRLGAHHHRSRSAALRPPVRAVPQSRAGVDAGFRHRFLPGAARRSDRLCARPVRGRPGGADHHLRLVPGPGRRAQRRPGARNAARTSRQARQARAAEPRPSGDAETGGVGRGAAAGGGQGRREGRPDAGDRRAARGPLFQRLDPCSGRRHRRPAADRTRAALPRPEIGDAGDPVQHEMGRTGRADEVRLSRPEDADGAQAGGRPHRPARRSRSISTRSRSTTPRPTRCSAGARRSGCSRWKAAACARRWSRCAPTGSRTSSRSIALYRPGPMANIPVYCARKLGHEKLDYIHPLLEPILKETFGVIVYQEQVQQIAKELSGYSLGAGRHPAPRDGQEDQEGDGRAARAFRRRRGRSRHRQGPRPTRSSTFAPNSPTTASTSRIRRLTRLSPTGPHGSRPTIRRNSSPPR